MFKDDHSFVDHFKSAYFPQTHLQIHEIEATSSVSSPEMPVLQIVPTGGNSEMHWVVGNEIGVFYDTKLGIRDKREVHKVNPIDARGSLSAEEAKRRTESNFNLT